MNQLAATQNQEIDRLRAEYVFERPADVIALLEAHRESSALLLEAVPPLRRAFGLDPVIHLRAQTDGDTSTLYALVRWKGSLSCAKEHLSLFDEEFWLSNSRRASGQVVVDYELY